MFLEQESKQSFYEILNVKRDENVDIIKKEYTKLIKKYHPDVSSSETENLFLVVQEAWETLKDNEKRKKYDQTLQILEFETKKNHGKITDVIKIDELDFNEQEETFSSDCRCGYSYTITLKELENGLDEVQCSGCSLFIKGKK
eukprot:gene7690-12156_t